MPQFTDIVRSMSSDKFAEILGASARKAREVYFARHSIRAPKLSSTKLPKAGAKNEIRTGLLFAAMQEREDEEMAEEILRTWLLGKRAMLATALDHLGIPHTDGLSDSDEVDKMAELSGAQLTGLMTKLKEVAPADEVTIYLRFMGCKVDA